MLPPKRSLGPIFSDEGQAVELLIRNGTIHKPKQCESCGWSNFTKERKLWRCSSCKKSRSILAGSFFATTKLRVDAVLEIGYYWLAKVSRDAIVDITGHSSATVTKMLGYYRQLVGDSLDMEDLVIGGRDIIVEIDEAKFGKRKFNRGHAVDGAWVLGGVEWSEQQKGKYFW
jgi:transposase-like protein